MTPAQAQMANRLRRGWIESAFGAHLMVVPPISKMILRPSTFKALVKGCLFETLTFGDVQVHCYKDMVPKVQEYFSR